MRAAVSSSADAGAILRLEHACTSSSLLTKTRAYYCEHYTFVRAMLYPNTTLQLTRSIAHAQKALRIVMNPLHFLGMNDNDN